jgi:hypothetical protein
MRLGADFLLFKPFEKHNYRLDRAAQYQTAQKVIAEDGEYYQME